MIAENYQTIEGSVMVFLHSLEGKNRSEGTIKAYRTDLLQFFIWLKENNIAASSPDRITRADIDEFLTSLARRKVSGVSRARKLAALREFFRHLEAHDVIAKAPTIGVETPKREKRSRAHLVSEEYNKLLSLAGGNPRDFAIFQVFLQTGVRVSELIKLTITDIDFNGGVLRVRQGKGMADRDIELGRKIIQAFKNYLAVRPESNYDIVFLNRFGEPIGERGVRKLVTKYYKDAGIIRKGSCHALRHTFATEKAKKGVSALQLKDWLGHSNLNTTQLYVHLAGQKDAHKLMDQTSL